MAKNNQINEFTLNMNHAGLEDMLVRTYGANIPIMIWGAPGIGKSTVVRASAKRIAESHKEEFLDWNSLSAAQRKALATSTDNTGKFIYADCRLSQYDPSDWAMPWVQSVDVDMVWAPSQVLRAFAVPGTSGMMFLDELPQAMPAVQNAAYQIILDRGYKDICFQNIRMVAAGNRSADGGNQYAFAPALANRLTHVELTSPYGKDWVASWARDHEIHPLICAFIGARPDNLYEDTGKTENRRYAWASPRSWEMASKLLHSLPIYEQANAEHWVAKAYELLYMTVGKGAAMEFQAYMLTLHDVFLEDYIKDPSKIREASVDIQLGVQAMWESHAKQLAMGKDDKAKVYLITQSLELVEQKFRADMRGMFLGGLLRAFRKDASTSGTRVINDLLKDNAKLHKRFQAVSSEFIELLTGQKC